MTHDGDTPDVQAPFTPKPDPARIKNTDSAGALPSVAEAAPLIDGDRPLMLTPDERDLRRAMAAANRAAEASTPDTSEPDIGKPRLAQIARADFLDELDAVLDGGRRIERRARRLYSAAANARYEPAYEEYRRMGEGAFMLKAAATALGMLDEALKCIERGEPVDRLTVKA